MPNWKKLLYSGSNGSLNSLNITTALTASGINYPTTDGTPGQAIVTDGSGNLSFTTISGGGAAETGSLLVTASIAGTTLTFTKGDASTFNLQLPTGGGNGYSGLSATAHHTQSVNSETWSFNHGLGDRLPVITVYDANEDVIIPNVISVVDEDNLNIVFTTARTGYATAVIMGDSASYAISSTTASYALTASYGENFVISGSINLNGYTWPTTDGTYGVEVLTTDGAGGLTFEIPRNVYETVKNVSGGPLVKGTPVHATGSATLGNAVGVIAADALDPTKMPATYVLHQNLADEEEGLGIAVGFITGVDTRGLLEGEVVYVAPGGGWTQTKPTGSALIQNLGIVTKVAENGSGVVLGTGRSNDVPNITQGYAWVGNADQVATATPTASFFVTSGSHALSADDAISSSFAVFALDAAHAATADQAINSDTLDNLDSTQFLRSDQTGVLTGDLTVTGTITAQEFHTELISASIVFQSGSTQFGNSADDIHVFTGSVNIDGAVSADSYTGLFLGALSSSAQIASDISGSFTSVSSSIATDISNIIDGTTTVTSASYAVSSSYSSNANLLDGINSTQFLRNDQNGTLLGNLQITGSLDVTGDINATSFTGSISIGEEDTLTVGSQRFFPQGNNGFSVNEDFDPSNSSLQTAYHFTSGVGRETVAFTLARTAQFTDGFGIYGTAANNTFVMFGEQNNTSFEWRRGIGIRPLDLDGGTLLARLNTAGQFSANSISASSGITGSLLGNALTATSASYALTASYALNVPVTASYALTASFVDPTYISASAAASGFGQGGVTEIIAGSGISINQGTGAVTVTALAASGSQGQNVIAPFAYAHITLNNYTANSGIGLSWGNYQYSAGNYGYYQFTFANAQPNSNYAVMTDMVVAGDINISAEITNRTTTGFRVNFYDQNGTELNVGSVATYEPIIQVYGSDPIATVGVAITGSLVSTGSLSSNTLTFTKGDGTTFGIDLTGIQPTSASYALTASYALNVPTTASYALSAATASYIDPTFISASAAASGFGAGGGGGTGDGFPYVGDAVITGSLLVSGSYISGSFKGDGSQLTGIDVGTVTTIGDTFTSQTQVVVTHNFNSRDVNVVVYNDSNEYIIPDTITLSTLNTVTVDFAVPTSGRIVVTKGGHIISALGLSSKAACVSTASFSATGSSFYYDVVFDSAFDSANYSVTLQAHSQYAVPTSFPGHAWVDSNKAASGFRIVVPSFDDTMDEICWTAIAHGESNVTASNAQTASFVEFSNIANKPTLISSSLQFNTLTTPFTGSFTGSFYGDGSNLSGVTSYTDADTLSYINSLGVLSGSAQIASNISGAFASTSSSLAQRIAAQEDFSSSLNATFATDAELSAVSGALASTISGISTDFADITNKPTLISSSLQFNTFSTPFTGSFTGSFYGDGSNLSGVTSYTDADTLAYINSLGVVSSSAQVNSGSFSGSFFGDGTGLTGLGYGDTKKLNQTVAATTWSFNHNMNEQYPTVTVYNSNNEVVQPSKIEAVSTSTLNLYFGIPTAGTAVAVVGGVALTQEAGFNRVLSQTSAATTWSFTHNLGNKYPQVIVYDSNDDLVIPGRVQVEDQNNLTIYFDTPQAGTATATVGGTSLTASYANNLTIVDTLLTTQENTDVDTGTETVATVSTTYYDGAFFDYVIKGGANYRAGTVTAVWDGSSVQYNEVSTADIGNTSAVTMSVDISGTDARLRASTTSDNWNIKAFVRAL